VTSSWFLIRTELRCTVNHTSHVRIILLSMLEQCKMTWIDGVNVTSCPNFFWNCDNNSNNNFSLLVPTNAHITLIYTPPYLAATCFGWSCTSYFNILVLLRYFYAPFFGVQAMVDASCLFNIYNFPVILSVHY